ncbi:related to ribitol kinase [Serendipita indica DSM 11827]|uniref:Related to ribitol kinase n=1 Tax=Serendipita indica (strain DSM 11827) TaxID=1109443 RepID=G4TIW0_SERID|nr:related to ribitol kinase [Serendipita indica DSM 11827]
MAYYLGIDVGTGSARVALVSSDGVLVASHTHDIQTWRSPTDARIFEQSTTDIFAAICSCVQAALSSANIDKSAIKGIGIDATCSLAVIDADGNPICVTSGDQCGQYGDRNIVLWADHRAEDEAGLINQTGSVVLDYVGGKMSLEMEIPKILWLKNHMPPEKFSKCIFFDLPDYLTYRITSSFARSSCSLVCKCSYIPPGATPATQGWNSDFFKATGLDTMVENGYSQLGGALGEALAGSQCAQGNLVLTAGLPVGRGLTKEAAERLGLVEGTPVGSGVIDAYAGWIGTIAARYATPGQPNQLSPTPTLEESQTRLAAVAGTSTCHLIQAPEGKFVPGVWGPYKNALFPGWWMNEGGQSSTGQLIDFMITTHPAYSELQEIAKKENKSIHTVLADVLDRLLLEAGTSSLTRLTKDLHLYPDLHGNRSPLADSTMRGSIVGLSLDSSLGDLARKFNVTLEAIALQTRHILDEMQAHGHHIEGIYISGGQAKNAPLVQLLADVCNTPIILPNNHAAAVVLGAAMLGRFAHEMAEDLTLRDKGQGFQTQQEVDEESQRIGSRLWDIMAEMSLPGTIISPAASDSDSKLLDAKYRIFREAIEIQTRWRATMEAASQ